MMGHSVYEEKNVLLIHDGGIMLSDRVYLTIIISSKWLLILNERVISRYQRWVREGITTACKGESTPSSSKRKFAFFNVHGMCVCDLILKTHFICTK